MKSAHKIKNLLFDMIQTSNWNLLGILVFIFAPLSLISCSTPVSKNQPTIQTENLNLGSQLTQAGKNQNPVRLENSDFIYFLSSDRQAHMNSQVYAFDLKNQKEKRLQFSDGETIQVIPIDGPSFFWVSTTDEDKENPEALYPGERKDKRKFTEIYQTHLKNLETERITSQSGYDGTLALNPKTMELYFLAENQNKNLSLKKYHLKTKQRALLQSGLPENTIGYWVFQKQIFVLTPNGSTTDLQAYQKGKWQVVHSWPEKIRSFSVFNVEKQNLILESFNPESKLSKLIFWDGSNQCEVLLLSTTEGEFSTPSYDENSQKLLFTFKKDTQSQIFLKNLILKSCQEKVLGTQI